MKTRRRWIENPTIIDYVLESYGGLEENRRVFLWNDGTPETKMGNIQGFAEHIIEKFDLVVTRRSAVVAVNNLLIEVGDRVRKTHKKFMSGGHVGEFKEPDAEVWVVGICEVIQ